MKILAFVSDVSNATLALPSFWSHGLFSSYL